MGVVGTGTGGSWRPVGVVIDNDASVMILVDMPRRDSPRLSEATGEGLVQSQLQVTASGALLRGLFCLSARSPSGSAGGVLTGARLGAVWFGRVALHVADRTVSCGIDPFHHCGMRHSSGSPLGRRAPGALTRSTRTPRRLLEPPPPPPPCCLVWTRRRVEDPSDPRG